MGRKFSFDLRLKLPQGKKASGSGVASGEQSRPDSPPPQYKSLGPSLSARVDAELRAACAYVTQEYKPSDQTWQELYGDDWLPPVFGPLDQTVKRLPVPVPVKSKQTNDRHARSQPLLSAWQGLDEELEEEEQDAMGSSLFERQGWPTGEEVAVASPVSLEPPRALSPPAATSSLARPKSIPLPVHYPAGMNKSEQSRKPKGAGPRAGSTDTVNFTPYTDFSEYPWSTAPTSAALASIQSSKRTSTQALQLSLDNPTFPTYDAEWMRRELDKHKKLQEARAQQEAQERLAISVLEETALGARAGASRPGRPGAERTSTGTAQPGLQRTSSDPRDNETHSPSRMQSEQSTSLEFGSLSVTHMPPPSRTESFTQYFRPEALEGNMQADERASRPESRRSSITRHLREYIRPRTTADRQTSTDRASIGSRALSIESGRTDLTRASLNSATNNWWRSFRLRSGSKRGESADPSRPETPGFQFRGRASTRDDTQTKAKFPVDLNRELPPLPSLAQWQDDEFVQPTMHQSQSSDLRDYDSHALMASDFDDQEATPVMSSNRARPQNGRRRSRSIHVDYPPELAEKIRTGQFGPSTSNGTLGMDTSSPVTATRPSTDGITGTQKQETMEHDSQASAQNRPYTAERNASRLSLFPRRLSIDILSASALNSKKPLTSAGEMSMRPRAETMAAALSLPADGQQQMPKRKWWQSKAKHESAWLSRSNGMAAAGGQ